MVSRLHIARTFMARMTCALALALAGLNIHITNAPALLDGEAWGGLAAMSAVVFGTGYLAVCGTELLLGTVRPPPDAGSIPIRHSVPDRYP